MSAPVAADRVPRHVAVIMDGNGRWAEARGLPRVQGHEVGADSVREIVRASREYGVEALTLYGFSTENWKRPGDEVEALMALLHRYLFSERDELLENGIRLNAIGQLDRLPAFVREPLAALCEHSRGNQRMVLTMALSYGSRAEIVGAVRRMAKAARDGQLDPDTIDDEVVSRHLDTAGLPDPDLLIRTSGEFRVSNFLLWQIAYAEVYVTDVAWPDFRRAQYDAALVAFASRERRFGKTGAQLRAGGSAG